MDDKRYRELGGVLQHVLDAIRMVYERGLWLELVTLIVPGFNDDASQLARAADYIAAISPEIPWHLTAFHKDYKMTDPDDTSDRKSTRLNSSHANISYARFCLKKKYISQIIILICTY